jgi:hypothetical protein
MRPIYIYKQDGFYHFLASDNERQFKELTGLTVISKEDIMCLQYFGVNLIQLPSPMELDLPVILS